MYSSKKITRHFIEKKLLASLLISKDFVPQLRNLPNLKNLTVTFNTIKNYDINLLTINSLLFLLFGQYPKIVFNKKLAKYRKSKISFSITFSTKNALYFLLKLHFLTISRQNEFTGYLYKTIFFIIPPKQFTFPVKSLNVFYLIDYLYGQQPKNILTVKQRFTLNVNCSFNKKSLNNLDILRLVNVPLNLDPQFSSIEKNLQTKLE